MMKLANRSALYTKSRPLQSITRPMQTSAVFSTSASVQEGGDEKHK